MMIFEEDTFYFGQVIKRRKENPGLSTNSMVLSYYFFGSEENWTNKIGEMRQACIDNNARAYIHVNRRSWTKVALRTLEIIASALTQGNPRAVKNAYHSACGQIHVEKRWLIDIDSHDLTINPPTQIHARFDTKNGYHLIVAPYDRRLTPELTIIKDGPTLVFAP